MPVHTLHVSVGSDKGDSNTAIADASKYLAYADHTDTYGHLGDVTGIHTDLNDAGYEWVVTITFNTRTITDEELKSFMGEMTRLSHVVSVEKPIDT